MNDFEGEQVLTELEELQEQVAGLHEVIEVLLLEKCCSKCDSKKSKK